MQHVAEHTNTNKWQRAANILQGFVGLAWYDGLIEFTFRFAAKTSEPLLAAGIVYSAADILSKGHIGNGNQTIENLWAISQALAIESSGGVVLTYGLTSLKERDNIKAWLYLIMSVLLAITGGIMLFLQFAGWEERVANPAFMMFLFGLRCFVSVGYIYLCRTKHIRFRDLAQDELALKEPETSITTSEIETIITTHMHSMERRFQDALYNALDEMRMATEPLQATQEQSTPLDGTVVSDFGNIPDTESLEASKQSNEETGVVERMEAIWSALSEEERETINGNTLYERAGRGMRKVRAYAFLTEKRLPHTQATLEQRLQQEEGAA